MSMRPSQEPDRSLPEIAQSFITEIDDLPPPRHMRITAETSSVVEQVGAFSAEGQRVKDIKVGYLDTPGSTEATIAGLRVSGVRVGVFRARKIRAVIGHYMVA